MTVSHNDRADVDDIAFALVLNLHQPEGNLGDLLSNDRWAAREILYALDRIRDHCGLTRISAASACRSPGRCWKPWPTPPVQARAHGIVDLSRLARNGLIRRVPGRNRYTLTRDGLLFAHFYTKVYDHLLRPLMAPDRPNAPPELAAALDILDQLTADLIARARVPTAA
jgi:hypothetical protein